jgi:membrane associated rhomboid family serine protease
MIPLKDNLRCIIRPTVTTLIIMINCVFFIIEEALLHFGPPYPAYVQVFGMFTSVNFTNAFSNAEPMSMLVTTCTLFTSMFLHSGYMHIFGNMVFLNCFGRAVEARLGKKQYLAFYLLAGLAASAGQYLSNPWSHIPGLGASGAIAGVLSAYMIFFPKAKIAGVSLQMGIIHARAWSFLLSWVALQVFSVVFEPAQHGGGVAYMAHIGGFVFGVMVGVFAMCLAPVGDVRYADGSRTKKRFTLADVRSIVGRVIAWSPIRRLIGVSRRFVAAVKRLLLKMKRKPRPSNGLQEPGGSGRV